MFETTDGTVIDPHDVSLFATLAVIVGGDQPWMKIPGSHETEPQRERLVELFRELMIQLIVEIAVDSMAQCCLHPPESTASLLASLEGTLAPGARLGDPGAGQTQCA
jgi:hypothetical protein